MTTSNPAKLLRLVAFDADDLAVISTNLQDAEIAVTELAFLPKDKRFALAGKRFDWMKSAVGGCERCATGLHFDCVLAVARQGFAPTEKDRILNLLAIAFKPQEPPGGTIVLTFSGGAAIRLEVECIEAQMHDLGPRWPCNHQPRHAIESEA